MEVDSKFPDLVARRRRELGMSQRRLAQKAGISNTTVHFIEQGRVSPRRDTMAMLCEALGLSLEFRADGVS